MAEERDLAHDPIGGQGDYAEGQGSPGAQQGAQAAGLSPANLPAAAYPSSEADYWLEIYSHELYYESGRSFEDYSPAYELGWVGYNIYGSDFDVADRVMANDWESRPRKSEHIAKWIGCSHGRGQSPDDRSRRHEQKTPPQSLSGIQGQGGDRGAGRRQDDCRGGAQARRPPQSGDRVATPVD